jgi:DNA-nicking Smr family endonuclease
MGTCEDENRATEIPDPHPPCTPDPHRVRIEDSLDLHAFAPRDIPSVVDEYLRAAHQVGLRCVRLIHGRGVGVQRVRVQQVLRDHPLVVSFADAPESHLGATVAHLVERQPE